MSRLLCQRSRNNNSLSHESRSTILNADDCLTQSLCRGPNRIASNETRDLVCSYEWSTERTTTNLSKHSLSILLHAFRFIGLTNLKYDIGSQRAERSNPIVYHLPLEVVITCLGRRRDGKTEGDARSWRN